jgi:hypothetical protein
MSSKLSVRIERITIVGGYGADKVILHTDLPPSVISSKLEPATLTLEVTRGCGEDYVKTNFPGVKYELISSRG